MNIEQGDYFIVAKGREVGGQESFISMYYGGKPHVSPIGYDSSYNNLLFVCLENTGDTVIGSCVVATGHRKDSLGEVVMFNDEWKLSTVSKSTAIAMGVDFKDKRQAAR